MYLQRTFVQVVFLGCFDPQNYLDLKILHETSTQKFLSYGIF